MMAFKISVPSVRSVIATLILVLLCCQTVAAMFVSNRMGLRETNIGQSASDCSQVEEECKDKWTAGSPVCGSNGITYVNLCSLRRVICRAADVHFKHDGECAASERCPSQRAAALLDRERSKYGVYVPDCEEDGSFQPMQCHRDTGYCWCVTPAGQTTGVSASKNRIKELNCSKNQGRRGDITRHRKPQELSCSPHSRFSRCVSKESCTSSRRLIFIDKIVERFVQEYQRQPEAQNNDEKDQKTAAVVWKFHNMNRNRDDFLGRREYRKLRKLVRRSRDFAPKSCAKEFPLLCDFDGNSKISLNEWRTCWRPQPSKFERRGGNRGDKKKKKKKKKGKRPTQNGKPDGPRKAKNSTCVREREQELSKVSMMSNGDSEQFVPVCDKRGRYRPYQCYGTADIWYCWCVNVLSGTQLAGTSIQSEVGSTLDCNSMTLPTKPWPRCRPAEDKRIFLDALVQYFNKTLGTRNGLSKQEIIVQMFHKLDVNQNNKLTRREIKSFQLRIASSRVLKRCGRRIHKVCDANDDKIIYLNEWQHCIEGHRQSPKKGTRTENSLNSLPKGERKNPWIETNPFVDILVSEE